MNGIPAIEVNFANGHRDNLVLERFYSSDEERKMKSPSCNFLGHLAKEETACVAVSGCLGDKMEMTIMSKHNALSNMYIWHKDGHVQVVESAFKDPRVKSETMRLEDDWTLVGSDELENPELVAGELAAAEQCASGGDCNQMPASQLMEIKIGYDDNFAESFDSAAEIETYLNSMVVHVQAHFCLDSLGTKIQLERVGDLTHHENQRWKAKTKFLRRMRRIIKRDETGADLYVFLTKDEQYYGTVGIAWVGTLCLPTWPGSECGITEKRNTVLETAEIVTHEMGHNLGMFHDFDSLHEGTGCDGTGFMSYGTHPYEWSTCSVSDFLASYNYKQNQGFEWCLDELATACGGSKNL